MCKDLVGIACKDHVEIMLGSCWDHVGITCKDHVEIMSGSCANVIFSCTCAAAAMKDKGQGWILNIASIESTTPYPSAPAYATSKWGLRGWSKSCFMVRTIVFASCSLGAALHAFLACLPLHCIGPQGLEQFFLPWRAYPPDFCRAALLHLLHRHSPLGKPMTAVLSHMQLPVSCNCCCAVSPRASWLLNICHHALIATVVPFTVRQL